MPPCDVGAGQIFKSLQQSRFIFAKILVRDNRGSPDFQVTSQNLPYFCQSLTRDDRGSSNFKSLQQKPLFLQNFQLVIIRAVQILKTFSKKLLYFCENLSS